MANDRLTPLDASFLHMENPAAHMHVACVMVFAGPLPGYEEFLEHIQARVHLVPRYRQRLAWVPMGQGRPRWVDDETFDLRFHVRSTALPSPGSESELQVLAGRVFSQPLRRDRPLWEMWLVEGLSGGRFALLSKTHHAVVDGISGLDVLSVLFAPDEQAGAIRPWRPQRAPSPLSLLAEALVERALLPAEMARSARALLRRPVRLAERAAGALAGGVALARAGLSPAPANPYNSRGIGPDRRFVWVRADLDDVKAIKNSLGGTVNDVVLAVVSGALRRHLERRGCDVEDLELKAFVPMSVRARDQRGTLGNQVSGMIASLPVGCADPASCLRRIGETMDQVKSSGQAVGALALTQLSGFAPPNLLDQAARLASRQRFINLVVTNVPGPQFPLQMAGRELLDIFPMVPLGANLALGVAIVSYNGTMNFGLVGDFVVMYDLDELALDFNEALEDLAAIAGVRLSQRRAQRRPATAPVLRLVSDRRPGTQSGGTGAPVGGEPAAARAGQTATGNGGRQAAPDALPEPWPGYDGLTVAQIAERLPALDEGALAAADAYERATKHRRGVLALTARELAPH